MENISSTRQIDHIGVVVRNIEEARKFYQLLGVGSFEKSGTPGKNKKLHGKPLIGGKTEMLMGKLGTAGIQLTQPVEPPSMAYEFLQEVGEGINHIAYQVDDIKKVTEEVVKQGYDIVFSSEYLEGGGEIYINTGHNFSIQLFQPPKK
jgi:catechol 2,3-dioxygenase-like lactoylglutathione lyase family enzyme